MVKTTKRKTIKNMNILKDLNQNKTRKLCDRINVFSNKPIFEPSLCKTVRNFAKGISSGKERNTIETFCKDMCFKKNSFIGCKGMTKKKYDIPIAEDIKKMVANMKKKNNGAKWKKAVKLHGKTKAEKLLRDAAMVSAKFTKSIVDGAITTCKTMVDEER